MMTKFVQTSAIALFAAALAVAALAPDTADARARGQGGRARETHWTGENGRTRDVRAQRSHDREAGTASRERDVTYNDGSTRSVDANAQRTAPGEYSATREVTGRNGETRTQTGDFSVTQTENGRHVDGDISTTNAGNIDYSRDVTHQDGVRSVNSSATFEDGTSVTRSSSASCGDGSCSSNGVVTGRNGASAEWDQTRTRTDNGVEVARDTNFSDGTSRSVDRTREGNGDGTGTVTRTARDRRGQTHTQTGTYETTSNPQ